MKKIIAIILITCVFVGVSSCLAKTEKINAVVNREVTIKFGIDLSEEITGWGNGAYHTTTNYSYNECYFRDANQKTIYPISYKGTTYLPVRAISSLLGIAIDWDSKSKSVLLGKGSVDSTALAFDLYKDSTEPESIEAIKNEDIKIIYNNVAQIFKDANDVVVYPISYNGSTYIPVRATSNLFNIVVEWEESSKTIFLRRKSKTTIFENEEIKTNLSNLNDSELEIALNEIFARYGHDFGSGRLSQYFSEKMWYSKIDGKKVSYDELSEIEQKNVDLIKNEVNKRKGYKNINEAVEEPLVLNEDFKEAEIDQSPDGEYYARIEDVSGDVSGEKVINYSNRVLLPKELYLVDDSIKYYYRYSGDTYYIPVSKAENIEEEKLVFRDYDIEIDFYSGDLLILNNKFENFFDIDKFDRLYDNYSIKNLKEFLISKVPNEASLIALECDFDNNLDTKEFSFRTVGIESEAGSNYIVSNNKTIVFDNNNNPIVQQFSDLVLSKNIKSYSNVFEKASNGFNDFDRGYTVKYYGIDYLLNSYIEEEIMDAYYLFVPYKGFFFVNRKLDGTKFDIKEGFYTLKEDISFMPVTNEVYSVESFLDYYESYKSIWLSTNNDYDIEREEEYIKIPKGTKLKIEKCVGWWEIVFVDEARENAYIVYFTPAGVT